MSHRRTRYLALFAPAVAAPLVIVACSGGGGTLAEEPQSASDGSASSVEASADAGTSSDGGGDGGDAAQPLNGSFGATVDGKKLSVTRIDVTETNGYYEITATEEEGDGIYFKAVSIQFAKSASGTEACGSILGLPDRTVRYGRYFRTGGQVATDKQYLSGLPLGPSCTFTIKGHAPEAGSASGSLSSDKALTGGGSVPPPVAFTLEWSGIDPNRE